MDIDFLVGEQENYNHIKLDNSFKVKTMHLLSGKFKNLIPQDKTRNLIPDKIIIVSNHILNRI